MWGKLVLVVVCQCDCLGMLVMMFGLGSRFLVVFGHFDPLGSVGWGLVDELGPKTILF